MTLEENSFVNERSAAEVVDAKRHGRDYAGPRVAAAGDRVVVIGLYPPPVDGQRLVTQMMYEAIGEALTPVRHDLDPFPLVPMLSKALSAATSIFVLAQARLAGGRIVYLAPHSGRGLAFSCLIAGMARLLGQRIFAHYHSYRNVARNSWLMRRFIGICGRGATHIALAPRMGEEMQERYRLDARVVALSNAAFIVPQRAAARPEGAPLRIGHLSNLSVEKGIDAVVDCMRAVVAAGIDAELVIGGGASSAAVRRILDDAAAELGARLRYRGPLDGAAVRRFYREIDVFLFPTAYEHEAEPLVVLDALAAGVPVLATARGCIRHVVGDEAGAVFEPGEFRTGAVEAIAAFAASPDRLAAASAGASARFAALRREGREALREILAAMAVAS